MIVTPIHEDCVLVVCQVLVRNHADSTHLSVCVGVSLSTPGMKHDLIFARMERGGLKKGGYEIPESICSKCI